LKASDTDQGPFVFLLYHYCTKLPETSSVKPHHTRHESKQIHIQGFHDSDLERFIFGFMKMNLERPNREEHSIDYGTEAAIYHPHYYTNEPYQLTPT